MPVSPIAPADASAATRAATETSRQTTPAAGFAEVLAGQQATTAQPASSAASGPPTATDLPTVTLGRMVQALASGEAPTTSAVPAAGGPGALQTAAAGAIDAPAAGRVTGEQVLSAGEQYLGVPYVWGGDDPAVGLDCSGFVQQAFGDLGIDLPRVSKDQSQAGQPVPSLAQARPGDLVYWDGTGGAPNHIGIYSGDNEMLVSPSSGDVVRYQELSSPPDAIRRVV